MHTDHSSIEQPPASIAGFRVFVDGAPRALVEGAAAMCLFEFDGIAHIEIVAPAPFQRVVVRPLSSGIRPEIDGKTVRFTLRRPCDLSVEFDGDAAAPLFLFALPPETDVPAADDKDTIVFGPGLHQFQHETLLLEAGRRVYLAPGAVVRNLTIAGNGSTRGVRIFGRGILENEPLPGNPRRPQGLAFAGSEDVEIEGITLVRRHGGWNIKLNKARDVRIRNIRIVSDSDCDDGIDICGSSDVLVEDCFIRTKDDCIAIKGFPPYLDTPEAPHPPAGERTMGEIAVRRCVLFNGIWGNPLEIGVETQGDLIQGIQFEDCDIIHALTHDPEVHYGALAIHHAGDAVISDVTYRNIRVEDCRMPLISVQVLLHDKYSYGVPRGRIARLRYENINVVDGGISRSLLRGYDEQHPIEDVRINGIFFAGRPIGRRTEMNLKVGRHVHGFTFK